MYKWLVIGLIGVAAGCGAELETGYKPHKLGVSDAERRAYYAAPFTPEAKAAAAEKQEELKARRPMP